LTRGLVLAGAELAWFLLFPSLAIVQKYLGTPASYAYFGIGSAVMITVGVRGLTLRSMLTSIDEHWIPWATAALIAGLVAAFLVLYPISNSGAASWLSPAGIGGGGSDRDESLNLGVRALVAGRYPYYAKTQLENPVTQMPGSLVLAVPFGLLGNAAWQNFFWFAVFLRVARYVFADGRLTLGFVTLILLSSPAVLHDFVTGGDLAANANSVLLATLLMLELVPDPSISGWKKIAAAVFAGIAFSSRLNYLLLLPLLLGALLRRGSRREAVKSVCVLVLTFTLVTLPFYLYDPNAFAPLQLHDKFSQFGEVQNGGILFPALSFLFSLTLASRAGNQTVRGFLIQSGLVLTLPVVFLVGLSTLRDWSNFAYTDYALAGVFFGGLGAGLGVVGQEPI
jgi:hypothetical protein